MVDEDMSDVDEIEVIVDIAGESLFNQAQRAGQNVMPVQLASTHAQSNEYVSDEDLSIVVEMMENLRIVVDEMEVESLLNQAQPGHNKVKRMLDQGVEPYANSSDNGLATLCQMQIFFALLASVINAFYLLR
ncbi:hypothetical protein AB1Y20_007207 [Prymnesium parvum]|uniref:PTS EIIA type-4 domain-containing protein n=1 Tax=Prymnesium parvum TaxID=97485 RepID=A0AB34IX45_PRYPA